MTDDAGVRAAVEAVTRREVDPLTAASLVVDAVIGAQG
jgi:hypothetical protein